jgi:hypothetical protein
MPLQHQVTIYFLVVQSESGKSWPADLKQAWHQRQINSQVLRSSTDCTRVRLKLMSSKYVCMYFRLKNDKNMVILTNIIASCEQIIVTTFHFKKIPIFSPKNWRKMFILTTYNCSFLCTVNCHNVAFQENRHFFAENAKESPK